jgi:phosphoglycolate phosphatase
MTGRDYDFWLLDLDGTLVDVEQSYVHDVFDEVSDRLGYEFSDREAELLWYDNDNVRGDILSRAGVDPERFWEVYHDVEDPGARADATYVFDDAEEFVPRIEEPIGLVTHCQEYLTGPILQELDIADWFDTVVCCSEEIGWKPDPEPVELAMSALGVAHNGHVGALAGDNPQDVQAAKNAGIDAIHVTRAGRGWDGNGSLGDRRVSTLTELNGRQ